MLTRRLGAGAALLLLAGSLAACGGDGTGAPAGPPGALALILGGHANSPRPHLVPEARAALTSAVHNGDEVTVIVNEGRPVAKPAPLVRDAQNDDARARQERDNIAMLEAAVQRARAKTAENNLLASIDLAARSVSAAGGRRTIVIVDSGLQTVAPLELQQPAMLGADPAEVATFLGDGAAVPQLAGVDVVLSGIGDTAAPQQPLSTGQRRNLVDVWTTVLERAGAKVRVLDVPLGGDALTDVPPVTAVTVTPPSSYDDAAQRVELRGDTVAFLPDQAVYRDAAEVENTLRPLAERVVRDRLAVTLIGTTASAGTPAGRATLSRKRAELVRSTLVKLGVDAAAVTSKGVGTNWPGHVADIDGKGRLLPGPAAQNRKVIVELERR